MGAETVDIDQSVVDEHAGAIESAASFFTAATLTVVDDKSTITANADGKFSFSTAQLLIQNFGSTMDNEVQSIRDIGATFDEYDKMLESLWESGPRTPTIEQG